MIRTLPSFEPPVAELFRLANTPFLPPDFRQACETFTNFNAKSSDDDLWYFSVPGGASLIVGLKTELTGRKNAKGRPELRQLAVNCAILSACWWETYMQSAHDSLESWQAERAEFDRIYDRLLQVAENALGRPRLRETDADDHAHQYAIWRGKTGLLILQQSAYDAQFGLDVNYWLQPWSGPDPRPTSPFIDWLFKLS